MKSPPKPQKALPPGTLPDHHIGVYDYKGRLRGRVGHLATAITAAHFTGQHGSKLGMKDGRVAWISPPPPAPPKPQVDPTAVAVAEKQAQQKPQINKLEIELKQAKGSATKTPSKPKTQPKAGK